MTWRARYDGLQSEGRQYRWQQWVPPQLTQCILSHFERKGGEGTSVSGAPVPTVTVVGIGSAFLRVNLWKAAGPDENPYCILRNNADERTCAKLLYAQTFLNSHYSIQTSPPALRRP